MVEDNVIVDRMGGRRVCEKCGASYHIVNKKSKVEGVCDLLRRQDSSSARTTSPPPCSTV